MGVVDLLLSEEVVGALMPVIVYWVYAGMYTALGPWCDKYRLHSKEEEDEMNLVSKQTVIKGVIFQQLFQATIFLLMYQVTGENTNGASTIKQPSSFIDIAKQVVIAMVIIDSYHYFFHRFVLHNKYLYKYIHSQHHRLVVPYSYGALYIHPIETVLGDTVSGILASVISGMSLQTSILFFSLVTIKSVDDHCGILLPGNPFHILFQTNTAYHGIHHELHGTKYNFSPIFFNIWDRILGTHMPYSIEKRVEGDFKVRLTKDYKEE